VSAVHTDKLAAPPIRRRHPRVARLLSIVPGLGQLYYGAPKRALQYLAGVVVPAGLVALIYRETMVDIAGLDMSGLLKSVIFLVSELVNLALVVTAISFWIAASWDAKQGAIAVNEGVERHPTWWYVKVKQFLFDDPEEDE
jgi:hypothetical protein